MTECAPLLFALRGSCLPCPEPIPGRLHSPYSPHWSLCLPGPYLQTPPHFTTLWSCGRGPCKAPDPSTRTLLNGPSPAYELLRRKKGEQNLARLYPAACLSLHPTGVSLEVKTAMVPVWSKAAPRKHEQQARSVHMAKGTSGMVSRQHLQIFKGTGWPLGLSMSYPSPFQGNAHYGEVLGIP